MSNFTCHYSFKTILQTHGRDIVGAEINLCKFFDEQFIEGVSNIMQSTVGYFLESATEVENGWFELELRWSGFWDIEAENEQAARNVAFDWLDASLTPVFQNFENYASRTARLQFVDLTEEKITEVV